MTELTQLFFWYFKNVRSVTEKINPPTITSESNYI